MDGHIKTKTTTELATHYTLHTTHYTLHTTCMCLQILIISVFYNEYFLNDNVNFI
jgi:hypothetical protein